MKKYFVHVTDRIGLREWGELKQKAKGYKKFKIRDRWGWCWYRVLKKWTREKFIMDKSRNWKYQSYVDEEGNECHPAGIEDTVINPQYEKGQDLKK